MKVLEVLGKAYQTLMLFLITRGLKSNDLEAILLQYFPFGVEIYGATEDFVQLQEIGASEDNGVGFFDAIAFGYLFGVIRLPCNKLIPFALARQYGLASLFVVMPDKQCQDDNSEYVIGLQVEKDEKLIPFLSFEGNRLKDITRFVCKDCCQVYLLSGGRKNM